jgi:hypothetical protein
MTRKHSQQAMRDVMQWVVTQDISNAVIGSKKDITLFNEHSSLSNTAEKKGRSRRQYAVQFSLSGAI